MAQRFIHRVLLIVVLLLLVGCDHASKGVAKAALETGGPRELIHGIVSLHYVENTDVGFNLLRWIPEAIRFPALLVVGALALVLLGFVLFQPRTKAGLPFFALVLLTAGALGNYLDRVFRGYVVDFVHLKYWPVFNVADIYVTLGLVALAWVWLRTPRSAARDG